MSTDLLATDDAKLKLRRETFRRTWRRKKGWGLRPIVTESWQQNRYGDWYHVWQFKGVDLRVVRVLTICDVKLEPRYNVGKNGCIVARHRSLTAAMRTAVGFFSGDDLMETHEETKIVPSTTEPQDVPAPVESTPATESQADETVAQPTEGKEMSTAAPAKKKKSGKKNGKAKAGKPVVTGMASRDGKTAKAPKAAKPKGEKKTSQLDAAYIVLKRSSKPMTCQQIVEKMEAEKLWSSPGGKTPAATLSSALRREIKDQGKDARFKFVERGLFEAKK